MKTRIIQLCAIAGATVITSISRADVTGFTDFKEWQSAVGSYSTIDFTGWPNGTIITDQYNHLGVTFTDGNDFILHSGGFLNDGEGLHGSWVDLQVTIEFDTPQLWIGVDHPGDASIDVFTGDTLIGTFHRLGSGVGFFTGLISSVPFDRAVIYRGFDNSPPFIDDLHWGIPAPGAIAVLALAALLGSPRRRRM